MQEQPKGHCRIRPGDRAVLRSASGSEVSEGRRAGPAHWPPSLFPLLPRVLTGGVLACSPFPSQRNASLPQRTLFPYGNRDCVSEWGCPAACPGLAAPRRQKPWALPPSSSVRLAEGTHLPPPAGAGHVAMATSSQAATAEGWGAGALAWAETPH